MACWSRLLNLPSLTCSKWSWINHWSTQSKWLYPSSNVITKKQEAWSTWLNIDQFHHWQSICVKTQPHAMQKSQDFLSNGPGTDNSRYVVFYNRLLSFNKRLYSFLIAATPEVADLINEIHHDMVGDSTDTMWLDDPGGNYLDDLLGKSTDFSYEELSRIVSGLHPKM